jgi:RNA polymerase-binding transcription factor DksA
MDEETEERIEKLEALIMSIYEKLQKQIDDLKDKIREKEYGV